jgi:hypothetical protein
MRRGGILNAQLAGALCFGRSPFPCMVDDTKPHRALRRIHQMGVSDGRKDDFADKRRDRWHRSESEPKVEV